jgi:hypothetical protein
MVRMRTKIEPPAFVLGHGGNSVEVSWWDLRHSDVGKTWEARGDSRSESATVLYADSLGRVVLHRTWGTTKDQALEWEQLEIVWYEFHEGTES